MKDNKEDISGYILAIIAGALLAVILKRLFESEHKKDGSDLAVALLGGAAGAGIYALQKKKNKTKESPSVDETQKLIAYNGDTREFFMNSENEGPIDSIRVAKLWATIPYVKRISRQLAKQYLKPNSGYELVYHCKSSYGKLQDDYSKVGHYEKTSDLKTMPKRISENDIRKIDYYAELSESDVKNIYENGKILTASNLFDFIGSDDVLSDEVFHDVTSAFYNKQLPQGYKLYYGEKSALSENLHINYRFQHDYYYQKIVKHIYSNLSDFDKLDKIADYAKCPNFSVKHPLTENKAYNLNIAMDAKIYDYYGLFGGTQKVVFDIDIYKYSKYYLVDLKLDITDWYGADFDDFFGDGFKAGVSCLNAFFWLQHHYGCSPFETGVLFHDYLLFTKED